MSMIIDFRFEGVPLRVGEIFSRVAPALSDAGLRMASFCHELKLSCSGDIDESLVRVDVSTMEEAEHVGYGWVGRVHEYRWPVEGQDVDISAYAWYADLGCFVLAMDRSEWRWIAAEKDRIIRCGELVCLVASVIGSPFGFMSVESEYTPVRVSDYEETLSRLGSGEACWPMLWVAQERLSQEAALDRLGRHYSVHYLTSGYSLALNEESLVQCAR